MIQLAVNRIITIAIFVYLIADWGVWVQYSDIVMSTMASQITDVSLVYSTVCSGADLRTHQSSAPLAFVWGEINGDRWIPHTNGQWRWKMFPFGDVIMKCLHCHFRFTNSSSNKLTFVNQSVLPAIRLNTIYANMLLDKGVEGANIITHNSI